MIVTDAPTIEKMVEAIKPLPDIRSESKRAAAYIAAGIDAADIVRLDNYALYCVLRGVLK